MSRTVTSGSITYIDTTDSRKLDVYIANNMPTVQIYNPNNQNPYSPDWAANNLTLTASIYLDSADVTNNEGMSIIWDKQIGTNTISDIAQGKTLTIKDNISNTNNIVTYICRASYKGVNAQSKIDFTRVDAGVNGTDGKPAPHVIAQYSVDGKTGWTPILNAATHKYIRYSYDGGTNWKTAIKMVGEDGTSVNIKGTATSKKEVSGTSYFELVYNGSTITGATLGDAYLLEGHLYVCVDSKDGNDYFMDVGQIQGPKGNDGNSEYVYIRYASKANPSNSAMKQDPDNTTTHIGICVSQAVNAPGTASSYTWSKFVGDSAKSIVLSGDSQVFKVSTSNVYTPATIKVTAQAFNTSVTTWTYSTNGGQTFVSTAPTGVSISGNVVTITGSTLTTNSLVIRASDGTYSDVFTVYKAFDGANGNPGAPGAPAPLVFLTNENITLSANAQGEITGSTTFITKVVGYVGNEKVLPELRTNSDGTINFLGGLPSYLTASYQTSGDELIVQFDIKDKTLGSASSTSGEISIPITSPVNISLPLNWSKVNTGAKGEQGNRGSDAYTVLLTNESHVFVGDVSNAVAGSAETQVLAYIGATQQKVKILEVNGQTAETSDTAVNDVSGLTFKCDTTGESNSPKITFTCTTAFKGKTNGGGTIPIKLSIGGVEITKMFTYSIAFKGATGGTGAQGPQGVAATSYWLVSSASAVQKTSTGTITVTPSTLTFTGKSKTGTNAPVDYACRWIIAYSTDGTNYTNLYTSTANEASKSINVATTYKTIRARMYMAGGTTALLDEQIIPVVVDGTSASLVNITPSSYYFKSTTGKDGTFTPDYIYLYPRFQTVTFSKWEYSINGGTSWVAASGANGLSIGTYNSVANTLRIARTSTLYTDAVTSISFRCVSSTASVYDTVSIAKIYDVVDLQIGGTNLLKSTATLDGILVGESTDRKLIARGGATIVKNYYNNLSAIKCNTIYQGIRFMADDFVDIFQIGDTYTFSVTCRNLTGGTVSAHSYFIAQVDGSRVDPVTSSTLAIMENGETKTASCSFTINQAILDAVKNGHLEISIQCQGSSVFPTTGDSALYMWGGKLEKGNKATDWSPAPEDITSTTFQIYAPDGYVLSNKLESLTLQTFAYEGSAAITSATYAWSYQENEKWITIADETTGSLSVTKDDVIKTKTYRCSMTHNGVTYHSTATVQDISDVYDVMICVSDNINPLTGIYYWVVYALLYSEQGEADALLGPISINAPTSPVSGDYWYAIDGSTQTVTLKKYNGSAWVTSTDKQTYKYDWRQIIDGTQQKAIGNTDKVQIISCNSFTSNATFQCIVADTDGEKLARCNIHLTDTSDPIVSSTAPVGIKDGQLWMQTQTDGTFLLYIWDADTSTWKQLNADTKNVVHTTKPSSYKTGDLWVVESDSAISGYTKGTLLQSNATTNTFAAAHWSPSLKYESELSEVQNALKAYKQYMTVDSNGLHMQAKNADGTLSPFQALFTNTRLSFYQDDLEVAYISDNKLNIYEASIDVLSVEKKIQLQKFEWAIESNGSMSLIVNY